MQNHAAISFLLVLPLSFIPAIRQQSPEVGPEVLVSENDGGALRVEPSAAIHGQNVVVAWNDSYGGARTKRLPGVSVAWTMSTDGGGSFQFGGYLPRGADESLLPGADSWSMADGSGNFYLQILCWDGDPQEILLYRMDESDPGQWHPLPSPIAVSKAERPGIDKRAMHVSDSGEVAIAFTVLSSPSAISLVRSTDRGEHWSAPIELSGSHPATRTGVSLTRHGDLVIAAWMEGAREVWWTESFDSGVNFDPARRLHTLARPVDPPEGYALGVGPAAEIANGPWLGADSSGGAYLTIAEGTEQGGTRILLFHRSAGAPEWTSPTVVGKSPDSASKVFPSLAVTDLGPAVLYYDRRGDPQGANTDTYLSVTTANGAWEDVRLSERSTNWLEAPGDPEHAMIQRNLGDYITLANDGNTLLAAWADAREGPSRIYCRIVRLRGELGR